MPFHQELNDGKRHCIQDGYNNYYLVNGDNVQIQIAPARLPTMKKNRAKTQGTFASAYINHGAAPQNAGYEYMVLIQPSPKELDAARRKAPYQILHKDSIAHVVIDKQTGITAYAAFETYLPQKRRTIPFHPCRNDGNAKAIWFQPLAQRMRPQFEYL